jgi:hypothetical protein
MNLSLSLVNNMSLTGSSTPVTVETPVVIANNSGTTVADQGGGVYRVTKTGGLDGTWDASAIGQSAHAGDFVVRVNPRQANLNLMIGVSTNATASNSFDISLAVFIKNDGSLDAYEAAAPTATNVSTYTASDYLFMRRVGSTITLLKGATTSVSAAAVIHTYTASSATVTFDSSFNNSSAAADCYAADVA